MVTGMAVSGSSSASSYARNSYVAIIEAVIETIGRKSDTLQVLTAILPYALALAEAELGALLVIDSATTPAGMAQTSKTEQMTLVAKQGLPAELIRQFSSGELGQRILAGQQIWLDQQNRPPNPQHPLLTRHRMRYLVATPIQVHAEVLGAIVVGSHRVGGQLLRPELQQRLDMLARLTGLYLENVRLRTSVAQPAAPVPSEPAQNNNDLEDLLAAVMSAEEEVANQNKDLGLLNALASEVGSSLQLKTILETAIQQTKVALNAEIGWVYTHEDNGALSLAEYQGLSDRYVQEMRYLRPGDGVEGMAFSRNETVLRDGLLFHSGRMRSMVESEGLRAVAAVPLIVQGKRFGVLAVAKKHVYDWSARDERMLASIGQRVSQALANSQMYHQAQETAEHLESSYSSLQQANEQLARRAEALERQMAELRHAEKQIWTALAASQEARRWSRPKSVTFSTDEELVNTLKRVLNSMGKRN